MSTIDSAEVCRPDAWMSGTYAEAVTARAGDVSLRDGEGWCRPLDVVRWAGAADGADESVLTRCRGQVLDIGCGAGRLVEALAVRGHDVLGIDVCPSAVVSTVRRGGSAHRGSVFDPVPGEGGWDTALLIDGNIGIGGDPPTLLRRVRDLVRGRGLLIVETCPADVDERRRVRIHAGHRAASPVFSWASVGTRALQRYASACGWMPCERWTSPPAERHFVAFRART